METNTKLEATQDTDALVTLRMGKNVIETCVTRMGQSDCPHVVLGVPPLAPGLAAGNSVSPSPGDSAGWLWVPWPNVSPTPPNAKPGVSPHPAPHTNQVPFFFPSFSFFLPLSYSLVDQLFNTFHPSSELPEVSCFKLNTFLFESTWVPGKFLALQMSSLEFLRCTQSLPLWFFFIFIISNLIPLCSRFNLFPAAVPCVPTYLNNFKKSVLKGPTWNFLRELLWVNRLYLIVLACLEGI